ncbi:MAG: DUF3899 domain-containing protein [Clostridia bacterium]|nr:DUF3899 domain-containing protein [Clostridia bacterium]
MKKIFGSFKNIKLRLLPAAVLVTLAYPTVKAILAPTNKLTVFSDVLLIVSLVLIAIGVVLTFARHGDFDITRYVFRRGVDKNAKPFEEYRKDREEQRGESFNYPLFFGLVYLAASLLIAYLFC